MTNCGDGFRSKNAISKDERLVFKYIPEVFALCLNANSRRSNYHLQRNLGAR